jgi:hypothetical protein
LSLLYHSHPLTRISQQPCLPSQSQRQIPTKAWKDSSVALSPSR